MTITSVEDARNFVSDNNLQTHNIYKSVDNAATNVSCSYKFPYGIWFRGEPNKNTLLLPKLFRLSTPQYYDEVSLCYHFQRMVVLPQGQEMTNYDWLCLMHHYGLPTRLLRWTDDVHIALYFAAASSPDSDGALHVLNARRLNVANRFANSFVDICAPKSLDVRVRSAMAFSRNDRGVSFNLDGVLNPNEETLVAQITKHSFVRMALGWLGRKPKAKVPGPVAAFSRRICETMNPHLTTFTLCGGRNFTDGIRPVGFRQETTLTNQEDAGTFLVTAIVPSDKKTAILSELNNLGVTHTSIRSFPPQNLASIADQWLF